MNKVCYSCRKRFPKEEIVKINGKNYCLECASKLSNKNHHGPAETAIPDIVVLSVDTVPVAIERYFQAISAEAILTLDMKSIRVQTVKNKMVRAFSLTYELDELKLSLLEDLKFQAANFGANAIIGLRTSMSTVESVDSEKLIFISMSGTPVILSDVSILTHHSGKVRKTRE
ncbi:hypothetical protein AT15_05050 [Kosmotoga arenicorallina S304]|uniref:Heavy metal-binding domain-containing protein n=1 Tax=Kosmotoga arenicorallina S304 TaxID=1453497 RepID=A0A176JVI3_9BACT|nr:heavy metal-binding domain-containing protein [Kosmotoga arenicorallina]OAA27587.1 hypothetical protein AT15_05050 [Kosmotoga arenicorallina S304]